MPTKSNEIPNTGIVDPTHTETAMPSGTEVAPEEAGYTELDVTQTSRDWLGNRAIGNIAYGISYAGEIPHPPETPQAAPEDVPNLPA